MNFTFPITFCISLFAICLELFYTQILGLKTWNHIVYIIIPFAILGYGTGANVYLLMAPWLKNMPKDAVSGLTLLFCGVSAILTTQILIDLPLSIDCLLHLRSASSIFLLCLSYVLVMLPFVFVAFLLPGFFTRAGSASSRLYFFDLLGAGCGAGLFFVLINTLEVFRSISVLAAILCGAGMLIITPKKRKLIGILTLAAVLVLGFQKEPAEYAVDSTKGWEYIPGYLKKGQYKILQQSWSPFGRTSITDILVPGLQTIQAQKNYGTFAINIDPAPKFMYFSLNYLAGSPAYHLNPSILDVLNPRLKLFSTPIEIPYKLLKNPRTVIIGTGGGRDIFLAQSHQAKEITGAEINPGVFSAMMPGGILYEYTGRVYTGPSTRIFNTDGRHLVKTLPSAKYDLIFINGVDTFAALSSGAYAYAESYLYTVEAVRDYLRILDDGGMITFVRWYLYEKPRETLRLFGIILEALRREGKESPLHHVVIGSFKGWGITMVKKTPFTPAELESARNYFNAHNMTPVYPYTESDKSDSNDMSKVYFHQFAQGFESNNPYFADHYPFDLSPSTDDNPFFFKYYKLDLRRLFNPVYQSHTGSIIYFVQAIILFQSIFFICLFLLLPLWVFRRQNLKSMPLQTAASLVVYFSALGYGFMLLEVPLMQKFTLLLGSPIYSISVTLAVLLVSTGMGSYFLKTSRLYIKNPSLLLTIHFILLILWAVLFQHFSPLVVERFIASSFLCRVLVISAFIFPLGMTLGIFFPLGLEKIGKSHEGTIPWAWGLNSSFSVLGSISAIILAQYQGFQFVMNIGVGIYALALIAFFGLSRTTPD